MKKYNSILIGILAIFFSSSASALTWDWSFGGESGTFVTDGSGGGAGTYNLVDFSVDSSLVGGTIGSFSGGEYVDGQFNTVQPYSFVYDGAAVTQWLHSGFNSFDWWTFDSLSSSISYFFGWESGNINDASKGAWWVSNSVSDHGAYDVTVSARDSNRVPDHGTTFSLLGLALFALVGVRRRFLA